MPACCFNTMWNIIIVTKYFKLSLFHGYNFKLPHLKLCRNTEFVFIHDQNFSQTSLMRLQVTQEGFVAGGHEWYDINIVTVYY